MIPQRNISLLSNRLARQGGRRIPESILERDYCLAWFLVGLSRSPLFKFLVFKGGTALKRCYFGNYRFSEDLDFSDPTLQTFQEFQKTARKVKVWTKVKPVVLQYLETGKLPQSGSSWPLPETGIPKTKERRPRQFPLTETLIDIAIYEKRPDDVMRWYDQRKSQKVGWWLSEFQEDKIAGALAYKYPDRAMDIWKRLAANLIAQVKPKAYEKAAAYLGKIQRVLKSQSKDKEWRIYLAQIRKEHARKRKLLEILGGLNDRRIVDLL